MHILLMTAGTLLKAGCFVILCGAVVLGPIAIRDLFKELSE